MYINLYVFFPVCIVPTAPTLLHVTVTDQNSLVVNWKEPAITNGEITKYKINVNDGAITMDSGGRETEFVVTELDPRSNYSMKVQACTSAGCGPFSDAIMNISLQGIHYYFVILSVSDPGCLVKSKL